jgi:hypothetical protein
MLARGHILAFVGKDATKCLKNIRTYIFQVVACLQTKALLLSALPTLAQTLQVGT